MLLFLLLVFLPAVPIETEVVETLTDCPGYFVEETPPEIPDILVGGNILNRTRYKVICQTLEDTRRFLTLYDTKNKIPVFSAYRFIGAQPGRPKEDWKIEPQLEDTNDDINMRLLEDYTTILDNQAVDSDYRNNQSYDRGHLYPSSHAPNESAKLSTFTLTNAVPQSRTFNSGNWSQMERCTKCLMEHYCIRNRTVIEAFVVTGAEQSDEKLNDKMNIPSRMWSAFCCNRTDGVWMSKAYWGHNVPNGNVTESSHEEMTTNFGIQIFPPLCSVRQKSQDKTTLCKKKCKFLTPSVPPADKDETSEKTTFPPNTTPTTTTPPTTTKMTQPTTSITSRSVIKKKQEDCEETEDRNKKEIEEEENNMEGEESIMKRVFII
ncbi:endonuclease domain-containing 1 protein isoform X1 [Oryzias melastigma]|uniref:Endonuclease domain-containing 1 protein n=1 Tax=Oryzias melastigma TaxID=30732 RepID=A0A3B3BT14_ORYME|nr:endonuclease domain-containing 1 protein isoform X1 [Oryzias melastigma]XP_036072692.1 endonuclease domain-containing 1 protein isoform X1 [Oryzias melastigma]